MELALELMPEIVGDESVGVKYAINGVLSVTCDGMPLLGETPEVKGLWSAAAVWIKEGPGVGKTVAELIVAWRVRDRRLRLEHRARCTHIQKATGHIVARASEGFNKMYGIVHPGEQWESNRRVRLSPFYEREQALGAVFFEAAGWERPQWYESNALAAREYGDRVTRREAEWDSRWWSPIINAEHLAMRDRAGDDRPDGVRDLRRHRSRRAGRGPAAGDAPDGRRPRPGRVHAAADAERRLQART